MMAEKPVDVLTILQSSNVVMLITHLAQLSPYFRGEAKRLFAMPRTWKAPAAQATEELPLSMSGTLPQT